MATTDVGPNPNDIIIHLVNPYKCSDCGNEFFMKNAFVNHFAEHVDKMKAQNPCHQILSGVSLASQQTNSITVTRDILQINENQMFELQDMSVDYTQLTPLQVLEQAGILNLPSPHKTNGNGSNTGSSMAKAEENECHDMSNAMCQNDVTPTFRQTQLQQDLNLIHSASGMNEQASLMNNPDNGQGSGISSVTNASQYLPTQCVNSANLETVIQQPAFIVNGGLKEELNVIIETPGPLPSGHMQEFVGIHDAAAEIGDLRGLRSWGDADIEAIMNGKHVVLVKKVLKPEYEGIGNKGVRVTCKICFAEFSNKSALTRHQVVHTGIKPHCCFTCFKEFNDISSLRKHALIHKRSHRCPICLKMFLRRRQMQLHLRHHNRKRFIQFGHKYHEVQVSTSRNEKEQIVHEFNLSALLNKQGGPASSSDSVIGDRNVVKDHSFTQGDNMRNANSHDQEGQMQKSESIIDQCKEINVQNLENSQTSPYKKMIYKCGHCKKIINTRPTLSRHLMLHTNEKPFNCEKCRKQFRHKSDLVHHYKTHFKPVKCQTCGSGFSKRLYLNKHLEKGCPFIAEDNEKFTVLPDLTFQCNSCHKILKSRTNMYRHMRVHAFEDRQSQKQNIKRISTGVIGVHGPSEGSSDSNPLSQNVSDYIRPLANSVGFQCAICEEEYRFKSFILNHVRMHLNLRPYKCQVCGAGFYGRYLLRKHQQNHTKPYKCPKCGKGFNRRYLMTNHFNKAHNEDSEDKMKDISFLSDEKLLSCDICGKTMKSYQKSLMQCHIRLHKDVRPHQCKECQKTFISDIALKKHMLNHSKPYVCQICNKGFSRRYLMIDHWEKACGLKLKQQKLQTVSGQIEALPKPLVIAASDGSASQQSGFITGDGVTLSVPYEVETVTEIDEQTGCETFRCIPCDKTFTVKNAMERHIKTFMKQTPCKYCKVNFQDKHLCLAHQRSCLGEVYQKINDVVKINAVVQHSESQEKVFKAMEVINKIDNYTSATQPEEIGSEGTLGDHANSVRNSADDIMDQNDSELPGLEAVKNRTVSALKSAQKYPCPQCDRSFMTTRGLKIHATSHVRLFKCEICGEDFTLVKAFRKHLKSHSEGNAETESAEGTDDMQQQTSELDTSDNKQTVEKSHEDDCNTKSELQVGLLTSDICKDSEKIKPKEPIDVSARLMQSGTRGRPFSCKMCRRRFTEESGLNSHIMQIHGTKTN